MGPLADADLATQLRFFTGAVASFRQSGGDFSVVHTVPPPPPGGVDGTLLSQQQQQQQQQQSQSRDGPALLVVLDSSFDPPTRAHQAMAREGVLSSSSSSSAGSAAPRLLLLLAVNNADKAAAPDDAVARRLALMRAFAGDVLADLDGGSDDGGGAGPLSADLCIDIALTTLPYFHAKSAAIAHSPAYPPGTRQVFLAGFDTLVRVFNPKYYAAPPASPPSSSHPPADAQPSPMARSLSPFFARASLRITLRPDGSSAWPDVAAQQAYVAGLLAEGGGLEGAGGRREWARDGVVLVDAADDGVEEAGGGVVSSTLARKAAGEGDAAVLERLLSPGVERAVRLAGMYREGGGR